MSTGYIPKRSGNEFANSSLYYDSTNTRLGVGTASPASTLDVNGAVRGGADTGSCTTSKAGVLRYSSSQIEYCDGTSWLDLDPVKVSGDQSSFVSQLFSNAGATGRTGPSQGNCNNVYGPNVVTVSTTGIQEWTVPISGSYSFIVQGASSGNGITKS